MSLAEPASICWLWTADEPPHDVPAHEYTPTRTRPHTSRTLHASLIYTCQLPQIINADKIAYSQFSAKNSNADCSSETQGVPIGIGALRERTKRLNVWTKRTGSRRRRNSRRPARTTAKRPARRLSRNRDIEHFVQDETKTIIETETTSLQETS